MGSQRLTRPGHPLLLISLAAAFALVALSWSAAPATAAAPTAKQARKAVSKATRGRVIRCTRQQGSRKRFNCRWLDRSSCRVRTVVTVKRQILRLGRRKRACPAPSRAAPLFGFNDNSVARGQVSAEDNARLTAGAGATGVRLTVDWRWAEPHPGKLNLDIYDAAYNAYMARGIKPILIPMLAPSWAMEPGTCNQWGKDCRYPPARDRADAYARFAALLAKRYPGAAAIEVWNEPNLKMFWASGPDPQRYTELAQATYRAVKQGNPAMPVIAGSVADNPQWEAGMPPGPFLKGLYRAGIRQAMDGLSLHPYPGLLDQTLAEVRAIRDAAGDGGRKLWLTETGYSTTGFASTSWPRKWSVSESSQADNLVSLYRKLIPMQDVSAVLFHTLIELPGDRPSSPAPGYGIVRLGTLEPKPAYCAVARVRGATGCR